MIIALTGPIAAGKNAVADILEDLGCAVIDADLVAHRAISEASEKIYETFKEQAEEKNVSIKNSDGSINRKTLGPIIFDNEENLKKQEAILHPIIDENLNRFIEENKEKTVVINATVLYKSQVIKKCNSIIFVTAPKLIRFFRIKKRNNLPTKEIFKRFFAQKNIFTKYKNLNADIYKVSNTKSLKVLRKKITKILKLCENKDD